MLAMPASAADSTSRGGRREGVGVVMSGGGAKGLYHVGVLEALEQYGVPIDYVAGTSMGSIVAAMYAAGFSPQDMREIVYSGEIKEWVSGKIDPNRYMSYYRQLGHSPSFVSFRFDLKSRKNKFMIPTNLLSSSQIDLALMGLFSPANEASKGNFDRLMVPFLCVASDMAGRRPVVFREGSLSEAVRASMSIPVVFKPVKKDDMLLYDGGIFDNYPWKAMDSEFRPDLIIGSICTDGNNPPDEDSNIMDQVFMLVMQNTDYDMPEEKGVTIRRGVAAGMLDFDAAESIMNQGYEDAVKQMPEILKRVKHRYKAEDYAARREAFRRRCPKLVFGDYHLEGLTPAQRSYLRNFVNVDRHSVDRQRNMSFDHLRDNLYGVLADGDFTMDYPTAVYDDEAGAYSFSARFRNKPNFKIVIGGNVSSTAFNQAYLGAHYQTIGRVAHEVGADIYLGPIYNWGQVGGRLDFYMWKPLFFDYSFNFAVRNFRHGAFGRMTKIDNIEQVKNSEVYMSYGLGVPFLRRSVFTLKSNIGQVNYHYDSPLANATDTDHSRFTFVGFKAEIARNTLDKFLYPRSGSDLKVSAIYISGHDKYQPGNSSRFVDKHYRGWFGGRFSWDKYFDLPGCKWFSLGMNFDALITNRPRFLTADATAMSMPAYTPIPHSHMIYMPDFRSNRFVAAGIMPTFDFNENFFFRLGFYAMHRERRDDWSRHKYGVADQRWHYISEASLVYHTPFGPVSLSLTKYELKSWKNMYLTFNFGYPIFAPKGTFY